MKKIIALTLSFVLIISTMGISLATEQTTFEKDVDSIIKSVMKKQQINEKNLSVYVKNINTNEEYFFNKNANRVDSKVNKEVGAFVGASTAKLMEGYAILKLHDEGKIDLFGTYVDPLNNKKYKLSSVMSTAIRMSANDQYSRAFRIVGRDKLNEGLAHIPNTYMYSEMIAPSLKLKKYGTTDVTRSTPKDLGFMLEDIFKNKSKETYNAIHSYLLGCHYTDRIPASLGHKYKVAHKTGTLPGGVYNDAGIVYGKQGTYIIVVMTKDLSKSKAYGFYRSFVPKVFAKMETDSVKYAKLQKNQTVVKSKKETVEKESLSSKTTPVIDSEKENIQE